MWVSERLSELERLLLVERDTVDEDDRLIVPVILDEEERDGDCERVLESDREYDVLIERVNDVLTVGDGVIETLEVSERELE